MILLLWLFDFSSSCYTDVIYTETCHSVNTIEYFRRININIVWYVQSLHFVVCLQDAHIYLPAIFSRIFLERFK